MDGPKPSSATNPPLGISNERNETFNLRGWSYLLANLLQSVFYFQLGLEDDAVRLSQCVNLSPLKAPTSYHFDIQSVEPSTTPGGIAKRRHVLGDHRTGSENRAGTNLDELMNANQSAHDNIILDDDVAA